MSNDEDHRIIAEVAQQMLDDRAKTKQPLRQDIRIVFNGTIVVLGDSAVTVGPDRTSLYLSPADVIKLADALKPAKPNNPNNKVLPK